MNKVRKLASALENCVAVSEPGLLAKPDALYLSMICFKPKLLGLLGASHHVILLKCARPCEAAAPGAWSHAGTVLTPDDSEALNLGKFSASDLFSDGGHDYITVSPDGKTPVDGAYKGCAVFRFANLARGKLEHGANRHPVPVATASVSSAECTLWTKGLSAGYAAWSGGLRVTGLVLPSRFSCAADHARRVTRATWRSGDASDCKSAYPGSIPGVASI